MEFRVTTEVWYVPNIYHIRIDSLGNNNGVVGVMFQHLLRLLPLRNLYSVISVSLYFLLGSHFLVLLSNLLLPYSLLVCPILACFKYLVTLMANTNE